MKFKWDTAFAALAVIGALVSFAFALFLGEAYGVVWSIFPALVMCVCVFFAGGLLGAMEESDYDE